MTIQLEFWEFCLFLVTVVVIITGVFLIKMLKQFTEAMKGLSDLVSDSQDELAGTMKNLEQVTQKVDGMSSQVNTIVNKVSNVTNSADRLILQPLGALIGNIIRNSNKKGKSVAQ